MIFYVVHTQREVVPWKLVCLQMLLMFGCDLVCVPVIPVQVDKKKECRLWDSNPRVRIHDDLNATR